MNTEIKKALDRCDKNIKESANEEEKLQYWKGMEFGIRLACRIIHLGTVEEAMEVLKNAMENSSDYAHGWHCNIAMAYYDSMAGKHEESCTVGNEAATRFMKLCFGVDTKQ